MIRNGAIINVTTDFRCALKITNKIGSAKTRKMPAGLSAIAKPPNIPAHKNDIDDCDFAAKMIEARCAVKQIKKTWSAKSAKELYKNGQLVMSVNPVSRPIRGLTNRRLTDSANIIMITRVAKNWKTTTHLGSASQIASDLKKSGYAAVLQGAKFKNSILSGVSQGDCSIKRTRPKK